MVYMITYYWQNSLHRETYTEEHETSALARFLWLTKNKIPFRIITTTRRRHYYNG